MTIDQCYETLSHYNERVKHYTSRPRGNPPEVRKAAWFLKYGHSSLGHCERCGDAGYLTKHGEAPILELHHRDENWRNYSPENLTYQCKECHAMSGNRFSWKALEAKMHLKGQPKALVIRGIREYIVADKSGDLAKLVERNKWTDEIMYDYWQKAIVYKAAAAAERAAEAIPVKVSLSAIAGLPYGLVEDLKKAVNGLGRFNLIMTD